MKIAISGKGGVGKTTISSLLSLYYDGLGREVLAVDADPDANLASALGIAKAGEVEPVTAMKDLIEERVGAGRDSVGTYFKLNPRVDDIPERFSVRKGGIRLLSMGMRGPGKGCACPDNVFIKELISHVLTRENMVIILDMEAGIEHLGRGTVRSVDCLLIVVEPSKLSIDSSLRIARWATDIGMRNIAFVANRFGGESWEEELLGECLGEDAPLVSRIPYSEELRVRDDRGLSLPSPGSPVMKAFEEIAGYLDGCS